jgi:uncharacterized protein
MKLSRLIEALTEPQAYEPRPDRVVVHQTHVSVVFLAGSFAYKVKKPLNLKFVDYSILAKRRHYCEEEVRLNRRLAHGVYQGVVPVSRNGAQLRMEGTGAVVEWAVKMQRLPEEAMLRVILERGEVGAGLIEELGRRIAGFHARADRSDRIAEFGRFDHVARLARENFTQAQAQVGSIISPAVFHRLRSLTEVFLAELKPCIEERVARGVPCDGHGDLRLDHVYLFPDRLPPADVPIVDCVEFNEAFRAADPVADMAFLVMELIEHDRRDLARLFRNAYFSASGDLQGQRLLPFYVAYRAAVRGKVEGMKACETEIPEHERTLARTVAQMHWMLGLGELEEPGRRPCLLLIGGLPGTGKSTLARKVARQAGFSVIRSDQVRKELAGTAGSNRTAAEFETGVYMLAWTDRTYQACHDKAQAILSGGGRVLVDASFREESKRRSFLEMAARHGIPGIMLVCQADPHRVQARLDSRRDDVSDAGWSIYLKASRRWEPLGTCTQRKSTTIDTNQAPETAVFHALRTLREHHVVS